MTTENEITLFRPGWAGSGLWRKGGRGLRGVGAGGRGGTRRSVSRVQHRDPVIGHGWPW